MSGNFTTAFTVDQTPAEVFKAITNVRCWWTGDIEGGTDELGDEFAYRYQDIHYSRQKITELVPDRKVVWHVVDANLSRNQDPGEWTGTDITFDIAPKDGQTELRFTHLGLVPTFECFDSCSNAWGYLVNTNLRNLITDGEGSAR
jgi:Activator of Hsp90 ATPase homolog 1-like protein